MRPIDSNAVRSSLIRKKLIKGACYATMGVISAVLSLPALVAICTSFKPEGQLFACTTAILPSTFTLASHTHVFGMAEFAGHLRHSLVMAGATGAAALAASVMAAHALTYKSLHGRLMIGRILWTIYKFSAIALMGPLFFLAIRFDRLDTYLILILANFSFALSVSIWLFVAFFESIPPELERAARADGCSRLMAVIHVILPLMASTIAAMCALAFILGWAEYLFERNMALTDAGRTASAGIIALPGNVSSNYALLTAVGTFIIVPVIILFLFFKHYITEGLSSAFVKHRL
jgi:ABC-type glycerol-3-phosphate transport system permease component